MATTLHEFSTLTSKGQLTLPKSIRQWLEVSAGSKVLFELRGNEVVLSRASADHEDPALRSFLGLLANDIRTGRNIGALPEDLALALVEHAGHDVDLNEDIEGDVAL